MKKIIVLTAVILLVLSVIFRNLDGNAKFIGILIGALICFIVSYLWQRYNNKQELKQLKKT